MQSSKRDSGHSAGNRRSTNNMTRPARRLLDSLCDHRADYRDFRKKRRSTSYMAKLNKCRNIWIISGLVMLLHPVPGFVSAVVLFTTFLCFAILDQN